MRESRQTFSKRFYVHRICLLASSDAFRAMFDGGYRERDAKDIEISNIRWDIFELMMRYIYTGSVDVNLDIAQDLLRATDQYLLEGLKHLCEYSIAQDISLESVSLMFELSEAFNSLTLRNAYILFILEKFDQLSVMPCKNTTESRPRGSISNSGRGTRGGAERYVGCGGSEPTKPTPGYKKENGSYTSNLTSTPGVFGSNVSRRAATISDAAANKSKKTAPAAVDGVSSVSQHSSGYQPIWGGVPSQVSMADIVKMGKPQSKVPSVPNVSHHNANAHQNHIQGFPSGASHQNQFSDNHTSNVSDVYRESGDCLVQHRSTDEEWPLIEQPSVASQPSISEPPTDSELHPDPANISYDRINHQTEIDEVHVTTRNSHHRGRGGAY